MKKSILKAGFTLGLLALGIVYAGKKTGILDSDDYLYDEYDTSNEKTRS